MRSACTRKPSSTPARSNAMKSAARNASGSTTRSTDEWLMSRSCHSAWFSKPATAYARSRRAMPHTRSQRTGLRLCGIAEEPFCDSPNGSSTSRTSVRIRWRTSSAILSMVPPSTATAASSAAWRSRCTTWFATGSGARPSEPSAVTSTSGSKCASVPTAPLNLPVAQPSSAVSRRSSPRPSSSLHSRHLSPNVIGSACTPWLRPTWGVFRCACASVHAARRTRATPAASKRPASCTWQASAVSTRSDEVSPACTWRASSPTDSASMLRKAITSCCTSASIACMRGASIRAAARMRATVPRGTSPRASRAPVAASSTSSQSSSRRASLQTLAISGRQ